ncbi:MAG: glycosyltransferase family 2 protein [Planctomycetia bacterium]
MSAPAVDFSLVIPVHDEEGNLQPLWDEVEALLATRRERAEVIFVNDGSRDGSSAVLDRLRARDARIRVLDHDRNHGLTAALDCGFRHARGAVIGMCDADLQNPPGELARLLDALPGYDMVIGWRKHRDDPWLKRISSRIGNGWRNWRTGEQVHDTGCGLKVFRREVIERIKLYNGLHRFLATLARYEGFRVTEVVVAHRPRASGTSHYGVWNRMFRGMRDTRGVRWLRDRQLSWKATERPPPAPPGQP